MKIEYKKRLFRKYITEKKGNLDQVVEELEHKISAKTQLFSRCRKIQNQYYKKKVFRADCRKFYKKILM